MKYNECSVDKRAFDHDCPEYCADFESLNERSVKAGKESCATQWNNHLSCWEKHSKHICDKENTDCAATAKAWTDCMTPYCAAIFAAEKTDPNCLITSTGGRPALVPF
jgi:hypothetical protein